MLVLQLAEKEATLKAAERELYPDNMSGKRVRKAKRLDFGDEATSTGNAANPKQKKAEEELLSEDSQFSSDPAESSSQGNNFTRDLQIQIKALQKENIKLQNMVVKDAVVNQFQHPRKLMSETSSTVESVS